MEHPLTLWIAESYSCQKDLIHLLKTAIFSKPIRIIASHSLQRAELKHYADLFIQQPTVEDAAEWLLAQCIAHQVSLLFSGKHGHVLEAKRQAFEAQGIVLVTGAIGVEHHTQINNKYDFTQRCLAENLPAIPCTQIQNVQQLELAIAAHKQHFVQICAKPVTGVYGVGFVQLRDDVNYFQKFQSSTLCNTQQFIEAYAQLNPAIDYLILPFLTGIECSVDIACAHGKVLAQVTRVKSGLSQQCEIAHPCQSWSDALVALFHCDGLINIQYKQDEQQQWHVLEINPRPAGGFAYGQHTGINLIAELIAEKLALTLQRHSIRPSVTVTSLMESFALDEPHR